MAITKAIIKKKANIDTNKYFVYIPWLRKANNSEEDATLEATRIAISGLKDDLNVGDVVYIDFEEEEYGKPVILGKLYTNKEQEINTALNVKSIVVQDKANLAGNTMIGNIDIDDIRKKIDSLSYPIFDEHNKLLGTDNYGNMVTTNIDITDVTDARIPDIDPNDYGKLIQVNNSGEIVPSDTLADSIEDHRIPNISSTNYGKLTMIDSNGNIVASTTPANTITDYRIPTINIPADTGKLTAIDSNGNIIPIPNKGLTSLSSLDSGKLVTVDNNGDLATTSNKKLSNISSSDVNKIISVDNNGNLSPVSNKGLFDLSSSDAGKLLTLSSDGNITPSTTTLVNLFMHYVYFQATISNDTKTVVCTQIITQDYNEFNAQNFVDYVNLILDPNKSNDGIPCTGSVRISGVDHKQCVQIRRGTVATGQPTASIKLMPIQATGGFDTAQNIPVSVITAIEDSVVRIF